MLPYFKDGCFLYVTLHSLWIKNIACVIKLLLHKWKSSRDQLQIVPKSKVHITLGTQSYKVFVLINACVSISLERFQWANYNELMCLNLMIQRYLLCSYLLNKTESRSDYSGKLHDFSPSIRKGQETRPRSDRKLYNREYAPVLTGEILYMLITFLMRSRFPRYYRWVPLISHSMSIKVSDFSCDDSELRKWISSQKVDLILKEQYA